MSSVHIILVHTLLRKLESRIENYNIAMHESLKEIHDYLDSGDLNTRDLDDAGGGSGNVSKEDMERLNMVQLTNILVSTSSKNPGTQKGKSNGAAGKQLRRPGTRETTPEPADDPMVQLTNRVATQPYTPDAVPTVAASMPHYLPAMPITWEHTAQWQYWQHALPQQWQYWQQALPQQWQHAQPQQHDLQHQQWLAGPQHEFQYPLRSLVEQNRQQQYTSAAAAVPADGPLDVLICGKLIATEQCYIT